MNKHEIEIFIDTSVLIHRFLRAQAKRKQVKHQLDGKKVITCSIVLHEYKRRVLREAAYLITLFHKKITVAEVRDHITNVTPPKQARKKTICLDILDNIIGDLPRDEQKERAVTFLHTFIQVGMDSAQNIVDLEFNATDCACARHQPKTLKPNLKYDFGPTKCEKVKNACGIAEYLEANKETIHNLLAYLADRKGELTPEMESIHQFLEKTKDNFEIAPDFNPCWKLGDLLIALESKDVTNFYTGNYKESRFFCEFFKQNLIVSSHNSDYDDKTYLINDLPWDLS